MSRRLNPLSLATSPRAEDETPFEKVGQAFPGQYGWGTQEVPVLSQEHVNVVSEGGNPDISPMRFPVVRTGHLRLKVRCTVQGLCEDTEGQGSLACCSPWGRRVGHDLVTKQQQQGL